MSKNNEYDNLVRKIFIKRKAKEIGIFLLATSAFIFMPYLIMLTLIIIGVVAGTRTWLINNWEASEKEAKRILKNGKKRKK